MAQWLNGLTKKQQPSFLVLPPECANKNPPAELADLTTYWNGTTWKRRSHINDGIMSRGVIQTATDHQEV
jgi:hypothetical protein